jgi:uncharacterized OB-fold protein
MNDPDPARPVATAGPSAEAAGPSPAPIGAPADWTRGGRGLALQRCARCAHVWYFRRDFCPACGAADPVSFAPAGEGTVDASTLVHRAPDDAFRALAPYRLVLVSLDEGPRVMAHGAPSLAIGERVRLTFREAAGRPVPYFEPSKDPAAP